MNGEHKITSSHRERAALIYLRQSSMAQVREHTESTRSQYALADKAAALGWAAQRHRGDRHRPGDLRQVGSGPGGVHRAGHQGLLRRCRGDLRDRDHPAGPVQRRRGPAGGVRPDHRHAADRPGRRLRPRRCERPRAAGLQGHHGRNGAPRDGPAAARQQAGRGRARRAAHPAAGRAGPRRRRRYRDRPRRRGPGRDPGRVRRVHRVRVGLRGRRRVRRPPVPAARLRRGVGRAAALGQAHPRPRDRASEESRATRAPTCTAGTPRGAPSSRTARCTPRWWNGPGPSGRC